VEILTQKALVDVRQSVVSLRDTSIENRPLPEQVQSVIKLCEESGLHIDFSLVGPVREISPQVALVVYRSAQECVNNTIKHSKATNVKVCLDFSQRDKLHFSFSDDGVGSEVPEGGFGLIGMKERVSLLDGEMKILTAKGEGFKVEIDLPG
jgi:signal transduction histidine kinase